METTWGQPTMLKGLSRFLVEHEPCGAGFDVAHPDGLGSGRVSMTCRGCGATYEYATATIEFEREVEFEPVTVRRAPAAPAAPPPPPPQPASGPVPQVLSGPPAPSAGPVAAQKPKRRLALPASGGLRMPRKGPKGTDKKRSRDRMIAAGLLLLSIAAFAFAIIRVTGENGEEASSPASAPAPEAVKPKPSKPDQPDKAAPANAQPSQKSKPEQPTKAPQPTASPGATNTPAAGEKVVKTARFSIVVPDSWQKRDADGGSLLSPPGDAPASVQVFYEADPGMSKEVLATQTAGFLRSRDPGAKVGSPEFHSVAGDPGFELHAVGPAGTQVAIGVLADPYRYLVIESADPTTPKSMREEADKALESFEPR